MGDIFDMPLILAPFSSWVSWLWVNRTSSRLLHEIPKQNTLARLAVELLLLIADFLPWEDASCLSLCNRRFFAIFHRRSRSVQPSGRDKVSFLIRLQRDLLPTYFICYLCHLLHKYDASKDFDLTVFDPVCPLPCIPHWSNHWSSLKMNVYDLVECTAIYRFYFFHLQLATRRFLYGPQFGISTEAMSYTCILPDPKAEKSLLLSIDAQMCCDPLGLVVRIQRIIYVPGHQRYLLYSNQNFETTKRRLILMDSPICAHVDAEDLAILINSIVRAHRDGERAPSSTYTCVRCDINFRIEICEYETDLALVITRWIDLGTGSTPEDPRWELHSHKWREPEYGQFRPAPNDDNTSARVRFENTSPRSLETLRSCNFSYLKNKRYETIMDQHLGPLWVLPRNNSFLRRWLA